jgi:hypothetical protein
VIQLLALMLLAFADKEVDAARLAYNGGDEKAEQQALGEVRELVDVSYDALEHSNRPPRKSKYYKNAELKLGALLRRLNSFRDQVSFESREAVEAVIKRVSDVHDEVLAAIMSKQK